jgi:protein involved in ribonucleotide reduction
MSDLIPELLDVEFQGKEANLAEIAAKVTEVLTAKKEQHAHGLCR